MGGIKFVVNLKAFGARGLCLARGAVIETDAVTRKAFGSRRDARSAIAFQFCGLAQLFPGLAAQWPKKCAPFKKFPPLRKSAPQINDEMEPAR